MAFPDGPYTNGQTHVEDGITYAYSADFGVWNRVITSSSSAALPSGSLDGQTFMWDQDLQQWNLVPNPGLWSFPNYPDDAAYAAAVSAAGAAMIPGARYWNTTEGQLRVYSGGAWEQTVLGAAGVTVVDNGDGTYTAGDVTIDTRVLSAQTLPESGSYANQIAECSGKLFKWISSPGTWVQVG